MVLDFTAGRDVLLQRRLAANEIDLLVRHGLIGIMANSEDSILRDDALPIFARLSARQQVMERHLRRILTTLHDASIPATVVKGPHLAGWAYRRPPERTYTDVDLLVPGDSADAALAILANDESIRSIPPKTPKAAKRHIPVVDESGVGFTIDLHWDLFSYSQLRGCADGATDWAWKHARLQSDHSLGPLWELPTETMVAFLGTHAVLDHRFRMILFRDLAEVARLDPDWEAVRAFVERWQLRSTTYVALNMAGLAADAPIDRGFLQTLRPNSAPIRAVERLLTATDLVNFDGHRIHPLNLAMVLLHDDRSSRLRLLAEAPIAFPSWRRRVDALPPSIRRRPDTGPRPGTPSLMLLVSGNRRRGAEVSGERLAAGLRARGWIVELVALSGEPEGPWIPADEVLSDQGVVSGRLDPGLVRRLRSRLRDSQPLVVLANGGSTLRYGAAAMAGLRRSPDLVYVSIGEPDYWLRGRRHTNLQRFLHRQADTIIAVSNLTRLQLIESVGVDPGDVVVAHTGVPDEFFETTPTPRGPEFRLLFLGNLSPEKGPETAVEILRRLSVHTPAKLRFVGSGPLMGTLKDLVSSGELGDRIEFAGSVDDVRPHLAWADALLLTSLTEGFPGVVLEAGAAGVPTAAFAVGGTAETIIDGRTGLLFPAGNVRGLAEGLERIAADRPLCMELGRAAKQHVADRFRLDQSVDRFDEILRSRVAVPVS